MWYVKKMEVNTSKIYIDTKILFHIPNHITHNLFEIINVILYMKKKKLKYIMKKCRRNTE